MKYTCAIFDLDGTLLNTLDDLTACTNFMLRSFGLPERGKEEVRSFVGNGIKKLIARALPENANVDEEQAFSIFMSYYKEHCNDRTVMYDGVEEVLKTLKERGIKLAIVSNKNHVACEKLKEKYFQGLVDVVLGENEAAGIRKKPAPDAVDQALKLLNAKKEESVYIGDSDVDVQTAKNAAMDEISVLWGFRDKALLQEVGATVFVEKASELLPFFPKVK